MLRGVILAGLVALGSVFATNQASAQYGYYPSYQVARPVIQVYPPYRAYSAYSVYTGPYNSGYSYYSTYRPIYNGPTYIPPQAIGYPIPAYATPTWPWARLNYGY